MKILSTTFSTCNNNRMELLRKVILGFSATVYRTLQCLIYIIMRFFSSICITVDPFLMYNIILIMCCLLIMYCRYCNSKFLKWPNVENLCDSLLDSLIQLVMSKMAHLSHGWAHYESSNAKFSKKSRKKWVPRISEHWQWQPACSLRCIESWGRCFRLKFIPYF